MSMIPTPYDRAHQVLLLPGDGIGPEITEVARRVADAAQTRQPIEWRVGLLGGAALDACGDPFPRATRQSCSEVDAVFLGAVGGPQWDDPKAEKRPEQGLLALRAELGVFANLRPIRVHPLAAALSPLRPEITQGVDLYFVRELTGGIYFGAKRREADRAVDECVYTVAEVERVTRVAAKAALSRRGRVTSIDKANVLETSRLWRETVSRVMAEEYPQIELEHLLVDAAAMHLLTRPRDFDVLLCGNLIGDILTDEASVLAGSLGVLPSASRGSGPVALYEPIHGSAPSLVGTDSANPVGAILSMAWLLRDSLNEVGAADRIEAAIDRAWRAGSLTPDLAGPDGPSVGTQEFTAQVLEMLAVSVA
jgi:3-isopropylmalate dehydrogenase